MSLASLSTGEVNPHPQHLAVAQRDFTGCSAKRPAVSARIDEPGKLTTRLGRGHAQS
jgi:hypothetical protein